MPSVSVANRNENVQAEIQPSDTVHTSRLPRPVSLQWVSVKRLLISVAFEVVPVWQ
jgi:hypothetical protein